MIRSDQKQITFVAPIAGFSGITVDSRSGETIVESDGFVAVTKTRTQFWIPLHNVAGIVTGRDYETETP